MRSYRRSLSARLSVSLKFSDTRGLFPSLFFSRVYISSLHPESPLTVVHDSNLYSPPRTPLPTLPIDSQASRAYKSSVIRGRDPGRDRYISKARELVPRRAQGGISEQTR